MNLTELKNLQAPLKDKYRAQPESAIIKQLDEHFTRSCQQCGFTIPAVKPNKTIDYISFLKGSNLKVLSHEVINEPLTSDHAPIVAVFEYSL